MLHLISKMSTKNLSVFFPCVNEQGNIEETVQKAIKVLQNLGLTYEIIIINDGSTDQTAKVIERLQKENNYIRSVHHPKNLGYGEALKSGFYGAKYDTIVYTDGDGQFDFSEITKFLQKIETNDVIIGYRIKRQDPFFRILFTRGWALALFFFFRLQLKDVDCGFKMIRRTVLEKISHLQSQRGAMINAELVIKAKKAGFKIAQTGVNHYPRLSGKPTGANIKVIFKSFVDLFKLWWQLKKEKGLFLLLVVILIFASLTRFYRISEYMTFLGDEGRDAIIVKEMVDIYHFPLIGPPTSIGNIYLGPLYYYMMFAAMAPFSLNPVAAAYMNAIIGVLTVGLVYLSGKLLFSKKSGLLAAFFYSISPVTIIYSKTSWNPNPAPFFALISILALIRIHKSGNFNWLIISGVAVASAAQMHYLALILIPITITIWGFEIFLRFRKKIPSTNLIKGSLLGIFSFFLVMSPLLWFDLRHNLLNYRAIKELFISNGAIGPNIFENLSKIPGLYSYNLIGRYLTAEDFYLTPVLGILLLLVILQWRWSFFVLYIWLFGGLIGLSFYKQSVYDHYLGFMSPVPFLLFGSFSTLVFRKNNINILKNLILAVLVFFLVFVNLQKSPLLNPPNNQLKRTQELAKFIIQQSENRDFNFALISKNNYDAAYQFYLDMYGHKAKQVPADITDQLFVVCEDAVCDPVHSPKYEIAAFGWSKIIWKQDLYGVKLYKLEHNPTGEPQ